ncbi:Pmt1 protein mannosyltransferase [Scheffersomyces amazonensis]|uniref:Pmt1 protein mannosyltransferase n=1 Tax=Scheffersomyces amazonensis TaxID=1078765 RepID=UPI00315CDE62
MARTRSAVAAAASKAASTQKHEKSDFLNFDPNVDVIYEKGSVRPYLITTSTKELVEKRSKFNIKEYYILAALVIFSCYIRLYGLTYPDSVVFDEVHFGGFAKKYILGTYFVDVHPPLAKLLIAASAAIGGFKGDFDFKTIGDKYPSTTPYLLMRQLPALLGIGTIILSYFTLRHSGVRPFIAFATTFLLIIENSNVTISRYILLDSPLLFFIAATIYGWKKFEIQIPFTLNWYKTLFSTSIALGLALSSKWVGLFTVAWVGILSAYQLWFLIGDLSISTKKIWGHAVARGSFLLGIPIILYIIFFAIHFQLLYKESDGSAFMSSAFRAGLQGNHVPTNIEANVGLGSIVTLRHVSTQGGYLHSHDHFYPTGSKQQQITLYPHLDSNNKWFIEPYQNTTIYNETFVPLKDGSKVRFRHVNTGRRLHSHDEKPPVSERDWQKEVSCYGFEGFGGDANDDWIVEIVSHKTPKNSRTNVKALTTIFKLRHAMSGNYLFSTETKLPEWGFKQQEVTAAGQGKRHLLEWYIETNENPYLTKGQREIVNYKKLSLFEKIIQVHKRMWKINQGLTEHHNWQSNPQDWPFLLRGINYWAKESKQVYLLGNAPIWYATTTAIFTFIIYTIVQIIKWHLGQEIAKDKDVFNFNHQVFTYILGWFLHYFPFFIMGRQLFLHHYLPSLYFGILVLGHFFDILVGYLLSKSVTLQKTGYGLVTLFLIGSSLFYLNYSPLIYGTPWTKGQCLQSKFGSWDFDCNVFHGTIGEYYSSPVIESPKETHVPLFEEIEKVKETPIVVHQNVAVKDEHQSEVAPPKQDTEQEIHDEDEKPVVPPPLANSEVETPKANGGVPEVVPEVEVADEETPIAEVKADGKEKVQQHYEVEEPVAQQEQEPQQEQEQEQEQEEPVVAEAV